MALCGFRMKSSSGDDVSSILQPMGPTKAHSRGHLHPSTRNRAPGTPRLCHRIQMVSRSCDLWLAALCHWESCPASAEQQRSGSLGRARRSKSEYSVLLRGFGMTDKRKGRMLTDRRGRPGDAVQYFDGRGIAPQRRGHLRALHEPADLAQHLARYLDSLGTRGFRVWRFGHALQD